MIDNYMRYAHINTNIDYHSAGNTAGGGDCDFGILFSLSPGNRFSSGTAAIFRSCCTYAPFSEAQVPST